jgi:transposase
MKAHPERKGRLQLIEYMFAGHSWQSAVAQSQLHVSRATAYRLRQLARDEEKAERAFLDDRHGHPYKLTAPVQAWISEFCMDHPQVASSQLQRELHSRFGVAVSVSQINRVRAKLGVSHRWRGWNQGPVKKN